MTARSDGSFGFGTDSWPGAAKLVEEAGELGQELGKLIQIVGKLIVNGGSTDYWGDRDLHQAFIEELGDMEATLAFFKEQNFTPFDHQRIETRRDEKLAKYAVWKGSKDADDE